MKMRLFLFFIALVIIGILFVLNIGKFQNLKNLVQNLNIWILILIIITRYLSYWANTKYFESFFDIFKHKIKFNRLFPVIMAMNFVNTVFPSGGISGVSYMSKELEGKIDGRTVTVAQIFWYPISFFCYLIFAIISFLLLFLSNQTGQISSKIVLIFMITIIVIGVAVAVVLFSRELSKKLLFWATRPINIVLNKFKRDTLSSNNIDSFFNDFYSALDYITKNHLKLKRPIFASFAYIIFEVASIYIVFLAFGAVVNPGVIIAGYIIALVFSLASFFTGGIGVYEATMVATFVALGQPFALGLSVVTIYRLVALWLFIPLGLYYYKKSMIDTTKYIKGKRTNGK